MLIFAPILGFVVGVAVNLLSDSLPYTRSIQGAHCHACGGPRQGLAFSALLGGLSGRTACAYCGTRRRGRNIVVEIVAIGGAIALALWNPDPAYFLSTLVIVGVFLLIVVIDIEHRLILHIVTFPAGLIFFLFAGMNSNLTFARSLIGGAFGFILFWGLYLLGGVFGRWMAARRGMDPQEVAFGFGDVSLATIIGLLLGFPAVIEALVRGILYAGMFSIIYLIVLSLRRRYASFIPIPYGPFLALGALWVYFQGWTTLERLVGM